jgi:hypothetical protein
MAVVEMAYLDSTMELGELLERLERIESGLGSAPAGRPSAPVAQSRRVDATTSPAAAPAPALPAPERPAEQPPPAEPPRPAGAQRPSDEAKDPSGPPLPGLVQVRDSWKEIRSRIETRKKGLGVCLNECAVHSVSGAKVVLAFPKGKEFEHTMADSANNRKIIQEEMHSVMKARLLVSCVVSSAARGEAHEEVSAPEEEGSGKVTPEDSVENIIDYFNGEIVED